MTRKVLLQHLWIISLLAHDDPPAYHPSVNHENCVAESGSRDVNALRPSTFVAGRFQSARSIDCNQVVNLCRLLYSSCIHLFKAYINLWHTLTTFKTIPHQHEKVTRQGVMKRVQGGKGTPRCLVRQRCWQPPRSHLR